MTNGNAVVITQASDELVEVRGCLSRIEWELLYLAAHKFAQAHALTITRFDLQSTEPNEPRQGLAVSAYGRDA